MKRNSRLYVHLIFCPSSHFQLAYNNELKTIINVSPYVLFSIFRTTPISNKKYLKALECVV